MKNRFILLPVILVFAVILKQCDSDKYSPEKYLTKEKQDSIIRNLVRYAAKLPPTASHKTKFSEEFDSYYSAVATDYDIRMYHPGNDGIHYLLVSRAARSIKPMRESIGLKVKFDNKGEFTWYEEIFRTWKMPEEIMEERYPILFEKMVKGESLEPYYPRNKGDQYIEFPDGRFYFDTKDRQWHDHVMDSLGVSVQN